MGIEPTSEAWEASILPLYDARSGSEYVQDTTGFASLATGSSGAMNFEGASFSRPSGRRTGAAPGAQLLP